MIKHVTRLFSELHSPAVFQKNPLGRELLRALRSDGGESGLLAVHQAIRLTAETLYVKDMLDETAKPSATQRLGIIVDGDLRGIPAKELAAQFKIGLRHFFRERLYCRRRIVEHLLHGAYQGDAAPLTHAQTRFSTWCDVAERFLHDGVNGDAMVALANAAQIASELALEEASVDLRPLQRRLFDLYEAALNPHG